MCGQGLFLGGGEGGPFVRISPPLEFLNTVQGVGARLVRSFQDNFRPLLIVGYMSVYLQLNTCKWGSYMFTCEQVLRYVQKTLFFRRVPKLQDKIWNGKPALKAYYPS